MYVRREDFIQEAIVLNELNTALVPLFVPFRLKLQQFLWYHAKQTRS